MDRSFSSHGNAGENNTTVRWFLLLFLLTGVLFLPVLGGELLPFDDDVNIYLNPHLHGLGWEQLKWIFAENGYLRRYQALSWLTWAELKQFFGLRPFVYHLAVLLFHAVNTGLVFLLINRLLRLSTRPSQPQAPPYLPICAALAAAIWGLHPLRVESTAWAVELVYVQGLFFFLLSLLCYPSAVSPERNPHYGRYWTAVGLFAASLASFSIALGGFVAFSALDIFPLRRISWDFRSWCSRTGRRAWLEKAPFFVIAVAAFWLNWHARAHLTAQAAAYWAKPPTLAEFGVFARAMQATFIWAYYVWKPWLPLGLTPVPPQLVGFNPHGAPFLLSAAFVVVLSAWLFYQRHRWPWALALWLCHLALLVPVLGLAEFPHHPSDRYSLVVTIGWAIVLGGLFAKIWPNPQARRVLLVALVFLLPTLGVLSYRQMFVWRTSPALFQHILAHLPDEPRLTVARVDFYGRLARAYEQHGELNEAVAAQKAALRLDPNFPEGHYRLAGILSAAGDVDAAAASYQTASRLDATLLPPFNDLGVAYAKSGRLDQAVAEFKEALVRQPDNPSALQNMAQALTMQGRTNEAGDYLTRLRQVRETAPANSH